MGSQPAVLDGRDLICANFTLGGLSGALTLEERAAAAAAGGFSWIGWLGDSYRAERAAGRSDADIRAVLAHHGVGVAEIEFLYGWASTGTDAPAESSLVLDPLDWHEQERLLFELAEIVGARHLNCGDVGMTGPLLPLDVVAERFAGICDRANEHGLLVGIEFLPWTEIPDAATALSIVERAGRRNGGVLVDAWHHFRGAADAQQLRAIPPEQVILIQLDDAGPAQGPAAEDTSFRRLMPGEGELDLVGLIRLLDDHGVNAPISIEVMSDQYSAMDPAVVAKRAFDSTSAVLAEARRAH